MINRIVRSFYLVNKHTPQQLAQSSKFLLCQQNEFQQFLNDDNLIHNEAFFSRVFNDAQAYSTYKKIIPYYLMGQQSTLVTMFIVKAEYHPELKTLKMVVLDTNGFYIKYLDLQYFIPVTWEDYLKKFIWHTPPTDEIDCEMVFKNEHAQEYYLFSRNCEWKQESLNHPDFDFRRLYKETEWLDDQIDSN